MRAAALLREQARACAAMGSPLYAELLARAAGDAEARGPVWAALAPHLDVSADPRSSALALRFMAAVHRMVLSGEAPGLVRHYPSTGGDGDVGGAWDALVRLVGARGERVSELVALPCQTNEVGRAAGLAVGFLAALARFPLPVRLLEVGASAGLNLRWDHFRYGGGGATWGELASPVDLSGMWATPPPRTDLAVEVVERAGCDRRPLDPASASDELVLRSSLWADQTERFARLDGALAIARRVPAAVDLASADLWVAARLAEPVPGALTIVYHSVVEEYLPADARARFHAELAAAGSRATTAAPLAWVRLEPVSELRRHGITLTLWPGGDEELVATCGAHGHDVRHRVRGATAPARTGPTT